MRIFACPRSLVIGPAATVVLVACGAGDPSAPADAPAAEAPATPPAMAEEKMTLERQVLAAKADLARQLGVSPDEIDVVEAREVTWPDTSLGCAEPGMMYAQVLTPGSLVVLSLAGDQYEYHAAESKVPRRCAMSMSQPPLPDSDRY